MHFHLPTRSQSCTRQPNHHRDLEKIWLSSNAYCLVSFLRKQSCFQCVCLGWAEGPASFFERLDQRRPADPYPPQNPRTSDGLTAPSIGGADIQQPLPNQRCGATEPRGERCSPRAMRCPLEQVRCDTQACCKFTNSFQRSEERRKLPLAIARAKGAISASYQVALPVLPGQ